MQYETLDDSEKLNGIKTRISELEHQHYYYELQRDEALAVEDLKAAQECADAMSGIITRINVHKVMRQQIENQAEGEEKG